MPKTEKNDPGTVTSTAPTVTTPTQTQKPTSASEFVIFIRSSRGTLHPVLDKSKGPGACATFDSLELAALKAKEIPECSRFPAVFVEVPR